MSEETVRLEDRIRTLERDNDILIERLENANRAYEILRSSTFTIGKVIKNCEDENYEEMLQIIKTYSTDAGVVVEVI